MIGSEEKGNGLGERKESWVDKLEADYARPGKPARGIWVFFILSVNIY